MNGKTNGKHSLFLSLSFDSSSIVFPCLRLPNPVLEHWLWRLWIHFYWTTISEYSSLFLSYLAEVKCYLEDIVWDEHFIFYRLPLGLQELLITSKLCPFSLPFLFFLLWDYLNFCSNETFQVLHAKVVKIT